MRWFRSPKRRQRRRHTCTEALEARILLTTPIHDIQGSGDASPLLGNSVTIDAIVVGDFQGTSGLDGFFVQEEDADTDANAATSEGLFVFEGGSTVDVAVGDRVQVTGTVTEFDGHTQLSSPVVTIIDSGNPLPTAADVDLPLDDAGREAFEGMLVSVSETLTVADTFNLGRFGQLDAIVGGRVAQFTQTNAPDVAGFAAYQADVAARTIVLDDGSTQQNPSVVQFGRGGQPLSPTNTLRSGDTVTGVVGVLDERFGEYRIQLADGLDFQPGNPRPTNAPVVGGTLSVASFNLDNYFTTIDNGSNFAFGADSTAELALQRQKLVAAILELDADVFGLVEVQNNADVATADLVAQLNAVAGAGTFAFTTDGGGTFPSTTAFVYKPATVTPIGAAAILDNSVDARFDDVQNRPSMAQTFEENASGERVTVVVNHFKSKGGTGTGLDADQGDGQSQFSETRTLAAEALVDWLDTDPTSSGDPDFLVVGDLNAYALEDPIEVLRDAGYVDLLGTSEYSFVFSGATGSLDHAFASPSLSALVAAAAPWHVNADEPRVFDYNDEIRDPAEFSSEQQQAGLFAADAFRSSDHDPLLVGLNLAATVSGTATIDARAVLTATNVDAATGETTSLPQDAPEIHEWQTFFVEIYGSTAGLDVQAAELRFDYDTSQFTATAVELGPGFSAVTTPVVDDANGTVRFDATADVANLGDDAFVLLAHIRFESLVGDDVPMDLVNRDFGGYEFATDVVGTVDVESAGVLVGETDSRPTTAVFPVSLDGDDNDRIDFGDLTRIVGLYLETVVPPDPIPADPATDPESPFEIAVDVNGDGRVDFADLTVFVANYLSNPADVIALPEAGANQLGYYDGLRRGRLWFGSSVATSGSSAAPFGASSGSGSGTASNAGTGSTTTGTSAATGFAGAWSTGAGSGAGYWDWWFQRPRL